ncbi:MAG TPA: diaminopimelate epimerase [Methylibium sp.]|uniref:diaminopimelate epimerase n=1 Tax=Methylibium sp. TaxID=2067992 RepID=UPI002DBB7A21|nr:diaminopimelate epimerase [Methylibium sp.]HEU4457895.1 diaminopimelate epimerase [Methylibium sp.]
MRLRFTKMQGAGNDFVVLDATRVPLALSPAQFQRLADRRYGVGADQILIVEPSNAAGIDFRYRIVNTDGGEVQQCGNGARCFVRFVRDAGLTTKDAIRVETAGGVIEPRLLPDGRVEVDMGPPRFEPASLPFDPAGLAMREEGGLALYALALDAPAWPVRPARIEVAAVSMGNPHAVIDTAQFGTLPAGLDAVAVLGPAIERHERFAERVNAGFMQCSSDTRVRLRVYERGVGETLACGTGACAAVAAGVRRGRLRAGADVRVETRGGELVLRWAGGADDAVFMSGPAVTVFTGEIDLS